MDEFEKRIKLQDEFALEQNAINETYLSSNVIYHYTKLDTALNHILPKLQFRLPSKKYANNPSENDPFENQQLLPNRGGMLPLGSEERRIFRERLEIINNKVEEKINEEIRIISFCTNSDALQDIDSLGFNKPRMWAQYGDNFKGVCVAINLQKLIEKNLINHNEQMFNEKISYLNFDRIFKNKTRIAYQDLYNSDDDSIVVENIVKREIKRIIFTKHKDYQDENEYRICHFNKEDFSFLDISNSIIGLIINSHTIDQNNKDKLFAYAKKLNLIITENDWNDQNLNNWHTKFN